MERLITKHTNPMTNKKAFIKKSKFTNISFLSKPNLSITKASNRFSLDRTYFQGSNRQNQKPKTARNTYYNQQSFAQGNYQMVFQTIRPTAINKFYNTNFSISRQRPHSMSMLVSHKQKLAQILESIDLNTSMIQQIFDHEKQIGFYKTQIQKTIQNQEELYQDLIKTKNIKRHKILKNNQDKLLQSFNQKMERQRQQAFFNKIEHLRFKNSSFIQKNSFCSNCRKSSLK